MAQAGAYPGEREMSGVDQRQWAIQERDGVARGRSTMPSSIQEEIPDNYSRSLNN
jgi:hypothetical protein